MDEGDAKKENFGQEKPDSVRERIPDVIDLRKDKTESFSEISQKIEIVPDLNFVAPEARINSRKFGVKFWFFLFLPIIAISIGGYFTYREIKLKNSPELSQVSLNQTEQTVQAEAEKPEEPASPSDEPINSINEASPQPENEDKSFSFAILGDTQYFKAGTNGNFQRAVKSLEKLNPDKVFSTGDLVGNCEQKDCESKLNSFKNVLGPLSAKFDAVQGNHDRADREKSDAIWQKFFNFPANGPSGFSELVYSLDFKNSHFVFLDSEDPKEHIINSAQRDWLEKDLANNKMENTFVFFHEPAYPISSKIDESLDADAADRDALWKILDAHNVSAVFSGHEHLNSRKKINSAVFSGAKNSIYQFIAGNTDAFNHDAPKAGMAEYFYRGNDFMFISVKGRSITVKVYSVDGNELNSFDFSK